MAEKPKTHVIWVSGNLHDRKLTLAQVKGQFPGADIRTLDGSYSVAYLEQIVRQDSVFADQRVIVIKDMPTPTSTRQTMVNQLKKLLDDMPEDAYIVFYGIPVDSEKAISSHVAKIGKLITYDDKLDSHVAANWVVDQFAKAGKEISGPDAQLLVDTSGHDKNVGGYGVDLLRIAVQKITLYLGRRKNVTTADVQANIFPSEEVIIWSVLDAMDSKDIVGCYNAFAKLVEKEDSVVGAVNLIYNIALPRYRMLMFLKEGMAQKKTKQDVAKEAVLLPKLSQSGKDWQMKMSVELAESGANEGQPKKMFTEFGVNAALYGQYGKAATIDTYTRKDVIRVVNCLESGLVELRARSASDAATAVMVDALFLAACTQVDDKILEDLRTPYGYTQ